jgi:hypothetical protein
MSVLADLTNWRSASPLTEATLPWRAVALLLCMAILGGVAAVLYPVVFAVPLQQF